MIIKSDIALKINGQIQCGLLLLCMVMRKASMFIILCGGFDEGCYLQGINSLRDNYCMIRPIICLNSDVQLQELSDGNYKIVTD